MSEQDFYLFCKALRWTTVGVVSLIVVTFILMLIALLLSSDIPVTEILMLTVMSFWFFRNYSCKELFFKREEVGRGYYGATGIMHPLWQNTVFWFFYIFLEVVMVLGAAHGFIKVIFEG